MKREERKEREEREEREREEREERGELNFIQQEEKTDGLCCLCECERESACECERESVRKMKVLVCAGGVSEREKERKSAC